MSNTDDNNNINEYYDNNGELRSADNTEQNDDEKISTSKLISSSVLKSLDKSDSNTSVVDNNTINNDESEVAEIPAVEAEQKKDPNNTKSSGATVVTPPTMAKNKDYFDDDEEFLKGDDSILLSSPDSGIIEQLENVVSWELDNFYDEAGKQRSKYALRSDPPVFTISSSKGEGARFVISKDLSRELERIFGDIHRGYYGMTPKEMRRVDQSTINSFKDNTIQEAKDHPLRFGLLALIIIASIIYIILG